MIIAVAGCGDRGQGSCLMHSTVAGRRQPRVAAKGDAEGAGGAVADTLGFTRTNLNRYAGTDKVEEGAREAVRLALIGPEGPTGTFSHATLGPIPR